MISFVIHITLALFLGSCIGLERQWRQRVAGLRTNTLVALGAAIFMIMACKIGGDAEGRVVSYIVSGMGFLGAGVILKDGATIRGLNTAATLWCTAAIGAFCGLGYIYEPVIGTVFIIGTHLILRPVSNKLRMVSSLKDIDTEEYHYTFTASCKEEVENHIRVLFVQYIGNNDNLMLNSLSSSDTMNSNIALIEANIVSLSKQDNAMEKIASYLTLEQGIISVKWKIDHINDNS